MKPPLFLLAALPLALIAAEPLPMDLPEGLVAEVAAAPPLVGHPIMATLGEPGKLFVGDAPGLNLGKAELEQQLPNRVLLLHDSNGDGVYDKSTVFADRMTFPQGGVWLEGSLFVASPPGIWKLTDTDADGVADQRVQIAGYFDFTGNAADVHGPFLHPNGRLYWCHGRKGHEVKQRDGALVHAGLASGLWSCRPDGADIQWHSLGSADNPVEIDFTPEGEILGTVNILYTNPRVDALMHWLPGGIYPREDQLKAIVGLPRTLDTMPVVHRFGHVAISGCAFYRSGALSPDWRGNLFVVHFNTQRVTRLEMAADGATFKVAEHEFLKLRHPDAHLTDVLEDRDGSLLVLDTGGWFRIGCPSSLMAKPDVAGAVYRIRRPGAPAPAQRWGAATEKVWELARRGEAGGLIELLRDPNPSIAHAAANALASLAAPEAAEALLAALDHPDAGVQLAAAHALGKLPPRDEKIARALLRRLEGKVDPAVEHQVMDALLRTQKPAPLLEALAAGAQPALQRRALMVLDQLPGAPLAATSVLPFLEAPDEALSRKAADLIARHQEWVPTAAAHFSERLGGERMTPVLLARLEQAMKPWLGEELVRDLVTALIQSQDAKRQRAAWRLLAASSAPVPEPRWAAPLQRALGQAAPADVPRLLDAMTKLTAPSLETVLAQFAADEKRPLALRLKALGASLKPTRALAADSFALLLRVLADPSSPSARIEAARLLVKTRLGPAQLRQVASTFPSLGPIELREIFKVVRKSKDAEIGLAFATALKNAPALASFSESEVRSAFGTYPEAAFAVLAPRLAELAAEDGARRRKLETWPALIAAQGRPDEGRKIFEMGKGACVACHRIGEIGNLVGPNLSAIGQIRTERDLLESILFPSASLARDYEAQSIETAQGPPLIGVLRRNLPEAIVVADASGQERTIPRAQIISLQTLPTSLMPVGLDHTLTEDELFDLVAFLRSRK